MLTVGVGPPLGRKNLVRQMGVERTGDVRDTLRVAVDKFDGALNVTDGAGNAQVAPCVAEINLHVNDDEMNVGLVSRSGR